MEMAVMVATAAMDLHLQEVWGLEEEETGTGRTASKLETSHGCATGTRPS